MKNLSIAAMHEEGLEIQALCFVIIGKEDLSAGIIKTNPNTNYIKQNGYVTYASC